MSYNFAKVVSYSFSKAAMGKWGGGFQDGDQRSI